MKTMSSLAMRASVVALFLSAPACMAGELLFNPINPGFGGPSNNVDYLLSLAQIQNQHLPASSGGGSSQAPVINFPPITIDLGGVGDALGTDATPDTTTDTTARVQDQFMQVGNGLLFPGRATN